MNSASQRLQAYGPLRVRSPKPWEPARSTMFGLHRVRTWPSTKKEVAGSGKEDRARRVLVLGVGLLDGLRQAPFCAVLAHEYGHFVHRDTAGGELALRVNNDMRKFALAMAEKRPSRPVESRLAVPQAVLVPLSTYHARGDTASGNPRRPGWPHVRTGARRLRGRASSGASRSSTSRSMRRFTGPCRPKHLLRDVYGVPVPSESASFSARSTRRYGARARRTIRILVRRKRFRSCARHALDQRRDRKRSCVGPVRGPRAPHSRDDWNGLPRD